MMYVENWAIPLFTYNMINTQWNNFLFLNNRYFLLGFYIKKNMPFKKLHYSSIFKNSALNFLCIISFVVINAV